MRLQPRKEFGHRHGEEEEERVWQVHRSLGGNPYDRLMGQFERTVKQNEDDDNELANELDRFVRIARRRFDEGEIDDEEHDL